MLGSARVSHFEISCRAHGGIPTVRLFRCFYLATGLPTGWVTFEKRRKRKHTVVPTCYLEPFDSLKGWRDKFFWVNAVVAPITMRWFTGKDFPRDSSVDPVDGDMILETLLKNNPTRIRRYPEEFLVLLGLSRMWYALVARHAFYDDDEHEMNL
ncbi:hypothetical protein Tco_0130926 [Tanacetum coccineum]